MNSSNDFPDARLPLRFSRWKRAIGGACHWRLPHGDLVSLVGRLSRGRGGAALADQVLVSGSNFLTSIVLVRGLGLTEFGRFTIAYVLLLYANALQMSFVALPMLSLAPQMEEEEKRRFVDGMFAIQLLASLMLFIVFGIAGGISRIFTSFYSVPSIIAFACCVGTYQLQDWLRRYYFLYNRGKLAIATDFISYFLQLVLLFALWRIGSLTLLRTFLVMFVTSLAAFAIGPLTSPLRPTLLHLRETWSRCRILSRGLLVANQVGWFSGQGVLLIGTGIVGTAAAGGIRATQSLAGPVNLVITSLENVIPIRVAEELKSRGAASAHAYVLRMILGCVLIFGPVIGIVAIFGRTILRVVYGPSMVAFYLPMILQLVGIIVQIAGRLWIYFYRGVQDTQAIIRSNGLSALVSIATVYILGRQFAAPGIVLASLAGQMMVVAYSSMHWSRHRDEFILRYQSQMSSEVDAVVAS